MYRVRLGVRTFVQLSVKQASLLRRHAHFQADTMRQRRWIHLAPRRATPWLEHLTNNKKGLSFWSKLAVAETRSQMIVHHPGRLHEGIDDRRAHKTHPARA